MIDFPITDLLDEQACYDWLVTLLHPGGLACPRCGRTDAYVHRYYREPVLDYRCKACGRVYNAFTGTDWHKTHRRPSQIVLILRGIAQGRSTAGLARELKASRGHLLERRHRMQGRARAAAEAGATPLPDGTVEADEMYQNAGEKRRPAHRPRRPAAAARQQGGRPRHLGQRPDTGRRCGGAGQRAARPEGGAAAEPGRVGRWLRTAGDPRDRGGVHR